MSVSVGSVAFELAMRTLDEQRAALGSFHTRAAAILSTTTGVAAVMGSVTAAVLGKDHPLSWLVVLPLAAVVAGMVWSGSVLVPRTMSFSLSAATVLDHYGVLQDEDALLGALARVADARADTNERVFSGKRARPSKDATPLPDDDDEATEKCPTVITRVGRQIYPRALTGRLRRSLFALFVQIALWLFVAQRMTT